MPVPWSVWDWCHPSSVLLGAKTFFPIPTIQSDPPREGLSANLRSIADEFCAGKKLRCMRRTGPQPFRQGVSSVFSETHGFKYLECLKWSG